MYPFLRLAFYNAQARRRGALAFGAAHVTQHIVMPWEIDFFGEMNNGYIMTMFDLGRVSMAARIGFVEMLKKQHWGMTVAGTTTRFRARIRMFNRLEMRSLVKGYDARFIYIQQTVYKPDGTPAASTLVRMAVTDQKGIVATARVVDALGMEMPAEGLSDWTEGWANLEAERPWPPEE